MDFKIALERIEAHEPVMLPESPGAAAVLILVVYSQQNDIYLLITKRSQLVTRYAGDYCFPGGCKEALDLDFKATIQREIKEELGMGENSYMFVGQLDDFYDHHHHLVRPYVAIAPKENFEATLSSEIEKIHFLPLSELQHMRIDKDLEKITHRHPAYKYVQDDVVIWGLTASILVQFSNIVNDLNMPIGKGIDW
jgi:8-oxo-dGTP pyrophosphatase MutT (NUDIX family)